MGQTIYFTRHGKIPGTEDKLSEIGKAELISIREHLAKKGFVPAVAFATDKHRTVESVHYLAPSVILVQLPRSRINGTVDMVRRFHADRMLQEILDNAQGRDALVVNHDCVPAVLALRYAEMRGADIDWKEAGLLYRMVKLRRGEGVLVCGVKFEFISP